MKRILIAGNINPSDVKASPPYLRSVRKAGAMPVVSFAENEADAELFAGVYDALLMPGGGDLPGEQFGQPRHPACSYDDPMRDLSDRLLFDAFRKAGKRILGICRGCQVINVFLGGTLHQHLPDAYSPVLWHSAHAEGRHAVAIAPGTLLATFFGAGEIKVNSHHHQAIDVLGAGLAIAAKAPDGVAEAVEGENVLLIQWHPERMDDGMLPIFEWLLG